jgi:hypothetical protein
MSTLAILAERKFRLRRDELGLEETALTHELQFRLRPIRRGRFDN